MWSYCQLFKEDNVEKGLRYIKQNRESLKM